MDKKKKSKLPIVFLEYRTIKENDQGEHKLWAFYVQSHEKQRDPNKA